MSEFGGERSEARARDDDGTRVLPVGALDGAQVRSVLLAAIAAPSPYDSQPWQFACTPQVIELHADRGRATHAHDRDHRELLLACGAALCNLRLAIRALGVRVEVRSFPDSNRPDLLATVRPVGRAPVTPTDRLLATAIHQRPNHGSTDRATAPASLLNRLRQAAETERGWLAILDGAQLTALRRLAYRAHRIQTQAGSGRSDRTPAIREADADSDPLVAVIGSFHDSLATRLQAGQATQRVLLTAAAAGLPAYFLPQVVEVPATRRALRTLIGGGLWPQTVLRIGTGPPQPPAPRRSLDDVARAGVHQDRHG